MKYNVRVSTEEYTIREVDPSDSWDIGETGIHILGIHVDRLKDSARYADGEAEPGDTIYAVVEHYSDGCTFGSGEYTDVKLCTTNAGEAYNYAKGTKPVDHGYFGHHISYEVFEGVL